MTKKNFEDYKKEAAKKNMLTSSEVTAIILVNLLVECVCIDFLVFRQVLLVL